jgi:hypothetical protein
MREPFHTLIWKASVGYNDSWSQVDPEVLEKFAESIVQECCNIIAKEADEWLEFGKNPPDGQLESAAAAVFTAFRLKEDTVEVLKEHFGLDK